MISVLIATQNRPRAVHLCLQSIQKSTHTNFEVLLLDQSTNTATKHVVDALHDPRLRYFHIQQRNKSVALNYGVGTARGTILCFTDDDCIVTKNWLFRIQHEFSVHPEVDGIFGSSFPYLPTTHLGMHCPSIFIQKQYRVVTRPCRHFVSIGFGNNMALRKRLLDAHQFRTWLGPNSIGGAAEDAEIALHLVVHGGTILCDPQCKVFHNKWLNPQETREQDIVYTRGELACYGYFYFKRYLFAKRVIQESFRESLRATENVVMSMFKHKPLRDTLSSLSYVLQECVNKLIGLYIGFHYAVIDPIIHTD